MKMIEIKQKKGDNILLNLDNIKVVMPDDDGTIFIYFITGQYPMKFYISFEEFKRQINLTND